MNTGNGSVNLETTQTDERQVREMTNIGINNIDTTNSTITMRRNSMKQRITSIAVAGIATVVIAGAGIMAGVNDNAVHADEPAKAIIVAGAGGSPDLPYLTYDEPKYAPRTALVGGSPDLPYLTFDEAKYRPIVGDNFGGGSPDLPNLTFDEPISDVLAYAGGSPDLPATF